MRKGALITGSMTCNSSPVDMRGTQLVPGTALRYRENLRVWVPVQFPAGSRFGQPKGVLRSWSNWALAICNCEGRMMGETPESRKGAMATGPAMVTRYSRFPLRPMSPPGVTSCWKGTGMVQQLILEMRQELGLFLNLGTGEPSGLVRMTFWT